MSHIKEAPENAGRFSELLEEGLPMHKEPEREREDSEQS